MITSSIVTYKTDRGELETVLRCTIASSVEHIYVVDNSPSDNLRWVVELSPKIEYIYGQGNVGYGSAHNIAIRKSIANGAKYHVVVNPDIEFSQGVIEGLADYMGQNFDIGQVMPRIIYPDGQLQYLCKLLPTPMDLIGRRFIPIKSYVERRNCRFEMRNFGYDKTLDVPFLSGCFMFLRVEALVKTDGFDDDFFMYCEDIDLCRRIVAVGYRTVYNPDFTVIHAHKKESFKSRAMLKAHIQSAVHYFNKWGWIFDKQRAEINGKVLSD